MLRQLSIRANRIALNLEKLFIIRIYIELLMLSVKSSKIIF